MNIVTFNNQIPKVGNFWRRQGRPGFFLSPGSLERYPTSVAGDAVSLQPDEIVGVTQIIFLIYTNHTSYN